MYLLYALFFAQRIMVDADVRGQPREWAVLPWWLLALSRIVTPSLPPFFSLLALVVLLGAPPWISWHVRQLPDERRRPRLPMAPANVQ